MNKECSYPFINNCEYCPIYEKGCKNKYEFENITVSSLDHPINTFKLQHIGLKPIDIWKKERIIDISTVVKGYLNSNMEVPIEWVIEYNELLKELNNKGEI